MGFSITKYVNIPVFIVSLAFGLFAVYITTEDTRKIYVYPTPENIELIQYRDKTGNCFKMDPEKVACPKNAKDISKVPPQ